MALNKYTHFVLEKCVEQRLFGSSVQQQLVQIAIETTKRLDSLNKTETKWCRNYYRPIRKNRSRTV